MAIHLKKVKDDDVINIASMAELIWNQYYIEIISKEQIDYMLDKFYSHQSLLEQIKQGQEFFIVHDNDIELGFISISKKDQNHFFIHKFYIFPKQHRSNIGTAVMASIIEKINTDFRLQSYIISLTVNRQNFKAINFYFKNGFKIKSVEDFDIGETFQMNDFVMEKKCENA